MTRQEAIEIIEKSQYKRVGTVSESELEEALDMAIEALQQEPCEYKRTDKRTETHACDCISRQDAIDVVLKHRNKAPKRYWNEYTRGWNDAIDSVADHYLLDVPSTEPKTGHWSEHQWAEITEGLLISNYECSICHMWERNDSDYCPNCGARMESDGE